jgi:glycosyltransferase involved in cell wall biosynthesis
MAPPVLRALIVTNMYPTPERPAHGSFVADQVTALRGTGEVELDVFAFAGGANDARAYVRAAAQLRRRWGATRFDVVHAHFGLTAWPARAARGRVHAVTLHGTDVVHPRSRVLTLAALPWQSLVAVVSQPLAARVPRWATRGRPPAILPTGVNLHRVAPGSRADARRALGLDPDGRYLLFPADPARPEKRVDRARALAGATGAQLLTLGAVAPDDVATYINAANAVLVTSARESFGLAALEALACDVPVLSTPVGAAPQVLRDLPGTLCAPFDAAVWRRAVDPHLETADSRLAGGRTRAAEYSTDACAAAVIAAWRTALPGG